MKVNLPIDRASAVEVDHVFCSIGRRPVLFNVNLNISRGSIAGILGPNGAGKTTLLSLVTGLRRFTEGSVTVLGESLPSCGRSLRRRIGIVFQETALYEELTVSENLIFSAALYGIEDQKKRIGETLELLGLRDLSGERVKTLSGGMRRRVSITRALLHKPDLLIIDEPTLGVDVEARHSIWQHLLTLKKEGVTVLISTNYLDEAQAVCDSVSVIRSGRVIVTESPARLIARAGSCLDIECGAGSMNKAVSILTGIEGVIRIDETPFGLSVFINNRVLPDDLILAVLKAVPINGFLIRPPDLAEVFRVLEGTV